MQIALLADFYYPYGMIGCLFLNQINNHIEFGCN